MRRNTSQRIAIEKVFREHDRPLGVDEVLAYGQTQVGSLNKATVYRNLKMLTDENWLKRLSHPLLVYCPVNYSY
ncbi:MAG: transcriptional repressor [Chlorobium sp.]|nr:transcriptional repressor [Chlorobium sp.]